MKTNKTYAFGHTTSSGTKDWKSGKQYCTGKVRDTPAFFVKYCLLWFVCTLVIILMFFPTALDVN